MRLIDADALLTSVYRNYGPIDALEDIRNAPTVDAEPVRHGQWIEDEYGQLKCSVCGIVQEDDPIKFERCPVCGAKMDEEAEQ